MESMIFIMGYCLESWALKEVSSNQEAVRVTVISLLKLKTVKRSSLCYANDGNLSGFETIEEKQRKF